LRAVSAERPDSGALAAPEKGCLARWAGALLLGMAGAALFLVILEGGARLLLEHQRPGLGFHIIHPEYGRWLKAGGAGHVRVMVGEMVGEGEFERVPVRISGQGLRDREYGRKGDDEVRILMLGDSYIFGNATVESESIPKHLERILAERMPGRAVSVINAGIGGTGPIEQAAFLRARGFPLDPDIVLHGVFAGNDIADTLMANGELLPVYNDTQRKMAIYYRNRANPALHCHLALARYSYAYDAARNGPLGPMGFLPYLARLGLLPSFEWPEFPPSAGREPIIEINIEPWYPELEAAFETMTGRLDGIVADCGERGVRYIGFCVPQLPDLSEEALRWYRGETDAEYVPAKGARRVQAHLEESGVPFIDIITPLESHPDKEGLYHVLDGHFNETGNRLVAELLADALIEDHADRLTR